MKKRAHRLGIINLGVAIMMSTLLKFTALLLVLRVFVTILAEVLSTILSHIGIKNTAGKLSLIYNEVAKVKHSVHKKELKLEAA